jgi:hypothetical protein
MTKRLCIGLAILALQMLAAPPPAVAKIGLARSEAIHDAEHVIHEYWPGAWRRNAHTLHCLRHRCVPSPPVVYGKKVSPEEAELNYSLITNLHPLTELSGRVYIHSDPISTSGSRFYYRVYRCSASSGHCRDVTTRA